MDKKLEELKREYKNTPIPKDLNKVVQKAIKQKEKKPLRPNSKWIIGLAAAVVIFMVSINTSPAFAKSLSKIPVVGSFIEVLTVLEIHVNENNYDADIKIPQVNNFENKEFENSLNQKYLDENQKLYESFTKEIEEMKKDGDGHLRIDTNYEVMTNDDLIFSIKRTVVETQASAYTTNKFDTIDKQKQIMLTLPILFKSDQYIETISEIIKKQMREQMENNPGNVYWVSDAGIEKLPEDDFFDQIDADQNFYINENHKLVIAFNEYEVAPGYMGAVEFVIPTKKIENILVGNKYIH
ncbi:anti-sigma-V factor rsiV [Virgibacillus ndiopensis]|uniref:anti-sigma-V factor rsiV n=1 Tax=Virgibacillus ndiopensis TaxID=2004408 RepID=UPI000C086C35|nr:anti-sigma-V factor rsiV [Virgibacillus ndiopensis]